jgi:citrate lyase subunit beta/citryl-CoA lyase
MQLRRSILYMPGVNIRAMEKAKSLDCDSIIFDLEDAVAPDVKITARKQVLKQLRKGGYAHRELVLRCNGLDTLWGEEDLFTFASESISALVFPKIQSLEQVQIIDAQLSACGSDLPIWIMIETPTAILGLETFAGHPRVEALVMGTSDLVKELRASHIQTRANLSYALQRSVVVARHCGKEIYDGVHLDFRNLESFAEACVQGREMGFDGKTLIHPSQIEIANHTFGYSSEALAHAQSVLEVWGQALADGKGVAVLDGQLLENLHAEEAKRIVAYWESLALRAVDAGNTDVVG